MSWQDELDQLLQKLGVQQERAQQEPSSAPAEFFIQGSRDHPGVFYRLDFAESTPVLRVFVPTQDGLLKMHVYLVELTPESFLRHYFGLFMSFPGGSPAFQQVEGAATFHLFQAMAEIMKGLF